MTIQASHNSFSKDCLNAITKAFHFAKENKYSYLTIDSIILFVLQTPKGKKLCQALNFDFNHLKNQTIQFLNENIPRIQNEDYDNIIPTKSVEYLLNNAIKLKDHRGQDDIADEHDIMLALFEDNHDSFILKYFNEMDIQRFDLASYVTYGKPRETQVNSDSSQNTMFSTPFLDKFAVNLNQKALAGKIDTLIGKEDVLEKMMITLGQRKKNNPLIVGDPGVGKTAIAEGLAKSIVEGKVPHYLKDLVIHCLDMPSLVAGTKYRGDFEDRLKNVIKEATQNPNIVLFIDEIHTLIGAGSGSGSMDASNILKPALSSGEIKVIGSTTVEEYRKHFEKEAALARRFKELFITEPTVEETIEILKGIKPGYELFHNIKYEFSALTAAAQLTHKFMNQKRLPDKAIDILDMAASEAKIKGSFTVNDSDISNLLSRILNIPLHSVQKNELEKLQNLSENLKNKVYGQNASIDHIVDSIILSRADLITKDKPIGSFLFAGPTGVGKTELTKQISKEMGIPLVRFDMSEYMEKHAVARLIGAPPGYIGHDNGGQLIEAIRKTPHCILLLDEIEKAHPDIFDILLQVMDYAVLTDNQGRKADFKNTLIVMTSNVGAQEISKKTIGFSEKLDLAHDREEQIKKLFKPEFYNRLDSVIHFNPLDKDSIMKIIQKQISYLSEKLLEKKIVLFTDEAVYKFILKNGFNDKLGARPIERYIETHISKPLSKEILFGNLSQGGEIKMQIKANQIKFNVVNNYSLTQKKEIKEI